MKTFVGQVSIGQISIGIVRIIILCRSLPNRAPIGDANRRETRISGKEKRIGMSEQEKRLAAERAEIAARVASFRATQQKFEREREEYFITTLQNARGIKPIPFWS
jgi:hypothetical protein